MFLSHWLFPPGIYTNGLKAFIFSAYFIFSADVLPLWFLSAVPFFYYRLFLLWVEEWGAVTTCLCLGGRGEGGGIGF